MGAGPHVNLSRLPEGLLWAPRGIVRGKRSAQGRKPGGVPYRQDCLSGVLTPMLEPCYSIRSEVPMRFLHFEACPGTSGLSCELRAYGPGFMLSAVVYVDHGLLMCSSPEPSMPDASLSDVLGIDCLGMAPPGERVEETLLRTLSITLSAH